MKAPADKFRPRTQPDWSFAVGLISVLMGAAAFVYVARSGTTRRTQPPALAELPESLGRVYRQSSLERARGAPGARDTLTEVTDFLCSACAASEARNRALVDRLVAGGHLLHRVWEAPAQPGSLAVSAAVDCSWRVSRADYWRFRPTLFAAQRALGVAYPVEPTILMLSGLAGIDSAGVEACLRTDVQAAFNGFAAALSAARDAGIPGTPLYALNGRVVSAAELPTVLTQLVR